MAYGDFAYTPPVNQVLIVECWGASGAGSFGNGPVNPGGGGGGGAYSRRAGIAVTAGVPELVRVGGPYNVPSNHESSFRGIQDPLALYGTSAGFLSAGLGGLASGGVGDVKFSGGDGAFNVDPSGGGGGSSAGRNGNGNNGSTPNGGAAPVGGAAGGNGGPPGEGPAADGQPGFAPGGGGGGAGTFSVTQPNGGTGREGAVVIWEDRGVWPPVGQTPLASYGSPPPGPVPKTPKSAVFM